MGAIKKMKFNWKYATLNNAPIIVVFIAYFLLLQFGIDPLWLILVTVVVWVPWYMYINWKVYKYSPDKDSHEGHRNRASFLIGIIIVVAYVLIAFALKIQNNPLAWIVLIMLINFDRDGFSPYKEAK
ncbi:hypothetical protein FD17_GL001338 [Lentilactobacillus sunkii DSM 19904]|uniref:Uncharacterized protein n=2 Tax=Lentilactobacillus sunkii TaxID=481719 RepID=A0A0R1KVG8_9LACO|nr:hypothetical protein FD17_GL001338 [Lentilactobacillus sunkii DSM 19904]